LRHARPDVEIVVLPRPGDPRDLFDFSGADAIIEEAYTLAATALDHRGSARERVRVFRRFRSA